VRSPSLRIHAQSRRPLAVLLALAALLPAAPRAVEPAIHAEATLGVDTNPLREAGGEQGAYPFLGAIVDVGVAHGGEQTTLKASLSEGARIFLPIAGADVADANVLASRLDLDGTWAATSQPVGSEMRFTLKEQNSQILGAGTYREVAGTTGALAVAGVHSGAAVTLELAYDNGTKATYAALLTDSTHMSGAFTVQGAGTSILEFARQ